MKTITIIAILAVTIVGYAVVPVAAVEGALRKQERELSAMDEPPGQCIERCVAYLKDMIDNLNCPDMCGVSGQGAANPECLEYCHAMNVDQAGALAKYLCATMMGCPPMPYEDSASP
jgi:hypothetical protein